MAQEWYFSRNGERYGPLTSAKLKELATKRRLARTDLVWRDGMNDWTQAGEIKGLFPSPAPPPSIPAKVAEPEIKEFSVAASGLEPASSRRDVVHRCQKCKTSIVSAADKMGKWVYCPKCQAAVKVSKEDSGIDSRQQEGVPLWNVVAGTKRSGPFGKARLRALVDAKRLPSNAFLRDNVGASDWTAIQTVHWLFDSPVAAHAMYCPECDCRVIVAANSLDTPSRCPACTAPVAFVDYLDFGAKPELGLPAAEPWGKFDALVLMSALVAVFAGGFGVISLVWNPPLSVLLGFIFLAAGGALFTVTFHHRSQTRKYREHLVEVENLLSARTPKLIATLNELHSIKRGLIQFRKLIAEQTEEEFRQQRVEIEQQLESATDSANAVHRMAKRFLDETKRWWTQKLTVDNFQQTKDRISKAISFCRRHGYPVSITQERELMDQLKADYEAVVRREHQRSEQKRIKDQMREEQRVQRELQREMERIDTEKRLIETALEEALARVGAEHSEEVEKLRARLQEAEENGKRTQAQAELTKVGNVYVISNIGSFGENVFKVGLTRRIEPEERVKELGNASVPFTFDIHMMIRSNDAPKFESALHQSLHKYRVNRVNFRKEFFRVDLETIRNTVEELLEEHGAVIEMFSPDAEALQYRESLDISDEDFEFLSKVTEAFGIADEDGYDILDEA